MIHKLWIQKLGLACDVTSSRVFCANYRQKMSLVGHFFGIMFFSVTNRHDWVEIDSISNGVPFMYSRDILPNILNRSRYVT